MTLDLDYDDTEEFSNCEDESTVFGETAEAEKSSIKLNFSLDYMKKVIITMNVTQKEKENTRENQPSIDSNPFPTNNILPTFALY